MAPSAIAVTALGPESKAEIGRTFGNYKEQASGAQAFNKKLEEEGDAHHAKANVCTCPYVCPATAETVT